MAKRKRRAFTTEFKAQAVRIVRESGKSVAVVARELDLTETALRSWVRQGEIDAGRGPAGALTTQEREELGRLRRENRTLRMERDILKKATVGSTGRRNAGGEYSAGGQEAKGFARSRVELEGDGVEIRLGVRREVGARREVLPQEPIRILVRPALPRTLGIAKGHSSRIRHPQAGHRSPTLGAAERGYSIQRARRFEHLVHSPADIPFMVARA